MDEQDMIQEAREKLKEIDARARSNTHRLDALEEWKSEAERKHDEYGQRITKTETNVDNLTKSMSALTKALWGIASAILVACITFFIR